MIAIDRLRCHVPDGDVRIRVLDGVEAIVARAADADKDGARARRVLQPLHGGGVGRVELQNVAQHERKRLTEARRRALVAEPDFLAHADLGVRDARDAADHARKAERRKELRLWIRRLIDEQQRIVLQQRRRVPVQRTQLHQLTVRRELRRFAPRAKHRTSRLDKFGEQTKSSQLPITIINFGF